jgi:3-hydroxyacyl-CoA dehydrogenase
MSYAIIGFGKIGQALAKAFARNGIDVSVANHARPESFAAEAAAIGPTVVAKTLRKRQGRHHLPGGPFERIGCREGAAELGRQDHRRRDEPVPGP